MRRKLLAFILSGLCIFALTFGAVEARAGIAANYSVSWLTNSTMDQNFDFGNPVSTSTTNLPKQVQTSLGLGFLETYIMSALLFGF